MNKWRELNIIGIKKIKNIEKRENIKFAIFNLLDVMKNKGKIMIKEKAKILIKPNICYIQGHETGATVDPFIVRCLVEWILNNYEVDEITIGEADASELNVDLAFKALGWEDQFKSLSNVKLLNLTKDKKIKIDINGLHSKKYNMSKKYMESDYLISVGKLKTNNMCDISCILKNQFGANPRKNKVVYHNDLKEVIYDINKIRIPDLCIVDGIIGMEGDGPINGIPKPAGIIIVGNDPVAVDHACSRIMGINPNKISYLRLAHKNKLGSFEYEVFGENINDIKMRFIHGKTFSKKLFMNAAFFIRNILNVFK